MNYFNRGTPVQFTVIFTDASGSNFDPSPLTFTYQNPQAVVTTLTYGVDAALVKDGGGHYHVNFDIPAATTAAGEWLWKWSGTAADGIGIASDEGKFGVNRGSF
jgi:hypothetical protein